MNWLKFFLFFFTSSVMELMTREKVAIAVEYKKKHKEFVKEIQRDIYNDWKEALSRYTVKPFNKIYKQPNSHNKSLRNLTDTGS